MKHLKWIVLGVVALVVIVLAIVWFNLNGIVRRTVETQASSSLDLQTTLGGANVSLLGGNVRLDDLEVASPEGFQAPRMFTLGGVFVDTSFGELRSDPIAVSRIEINKPRLVVEQAGGKFNFQVLTDKESKAPPPESGEPIKLIINDLAVNEAQVVLRPGIPGLAQEINVTIPSFQLKDIGTGEGSKNGAAIKEVVMLVVTTLAQKAAESDALPADVRQLLSLNVDQVKLQVQAEIDKQLGKITEDLGKKLPGDLGKGLGTDAGKAVEKGLGDLLGGSKDKKPATQPN